MRDVHEPVYLIICSAVSIAYSSFLVLSPKMMFKEKISEVAHGQIFDFKNL